MARGNQLRFVEAVRGLDGPTMFDLLPRLSLTDLDVFRQDWFAGHFGTLDPTNVLCAGDYADQFLNLPGHAVALYDAALEFMHKYPESIEQDTDCAAASLNLIDLLVKSGQKQAAAAATKRAARMHAKRPVQSIQLAHWSFKMGDAKTAYALFRRGKTAGFPLIAAEMGVSVEDLSQMEQVLARFSGAV